MIDLIRIYLTATGSCTVIFAMTAIAAARIRKSNLNFENTLARRYISILNHALLGNDGQCLFPLIKRRRARLLLAVIVSKFCSSTYGYDRNITYTIARRYRLDRSVLHRVRLSSGMRRAQWLNTLSALPTDDRTCRRITSRYLGSRNEYTSLYAMLTAMNHAPEKCIVLLRDYPRQLHPLAISEVLMMFKRGLIPTAYQPMLDSESRNVRMLGLCVVRHFGIVEAEEQIAKAVNSDDRSISSAALFTLCSLRLPLNRPEVRRATARMDPNTRRIWYRHWASEGYSASAMERIIPKGDREQLHGYIAEMIGSYKRPLTT